MHRVAGDGAGLGRIIPHRHGPLAPLAPILRLGRAIGGERDRPVPVSAEAADAGALGGLDDQLVGPARCGCGRGRHRDIGHKRRPPAGFLVGGVEDRGTAPEDYGKQQAGES